MEYMMNTTTNDCSVCSVTNALLALGIKTDRQEVIKATKYDGVKGGLGDHGLRYFAEKLNLKGECYPLGKDVVWTKDPVKPNISYALPENNKYRFFEEYKKRLKDGWVAVTAHRWGTSDDFHNVALIGVENDKMKVCCSLRGVYLADQEFFVSSTNRTNGLIDTFWVKINE